MEVWMKIRQKPPVSGQIPASWGRRRAKGGRRQRGESNGTNGKGRRALWRRRARSEMGWAAGSRDGRGREREERENEEREERRKR